MEIAPIGVTGPADRLLVAGLREISPILDELDPAVLVVGGLMGRLWLHGQRLLAGLRRASAIAAMVAAGWFAHSQFGPLLVGPVVASAQPPSYVDDALMAHTTTLLRGSMPSQLEAPIYRPDEIRSATALVLPELPRDWQLLDVQIFPSKFGPSVELAARSPELGVLSLFAVRPGDFAVIPTRHVIEGDVSAAYWQTGEIAYALVARTDAHDLERTATSLARTLY